MFETVRMQELRHGDAGSAAKAALLLMEVPYLALTPQDTPEVAFATLPGGFVARCVQLLATLLAVLPQPDASQRVGTLLQVSKPAPYL